MCDFSAHPMHGNEVNAVPQLCDLRNVRIHSLSCCCQASFVSRCIKRCFTPCPRTVRTSRLVWLPRQQSPASPASYLWPPVVARAPQLAAACMPHALHPQPTHTWARAHAPHMVGGQQLTDTATFPWFAKSGSLKHRRALPFAFAVSRLDGFTSDAYLTRGTNSTPGGSVSPCACTPRLLLCS